MLGVQLRIRRDEEEAVILALDPSRERFGAAQLARNASRTSYLSILLSRFNWLRPFSFKRAEKKRRLEPAKV